MNRYNPHSDSRDVVWHVEYIQGDRTMPDTIDVVMSGNDSSLIKITERIAQLRSYPPGSVAIVTAYVKRYV